MAFVLVAALLAADVAATMVGVAFMVYGRWL
jgi:hypothetical protein